MYGKVKVQAYCNFFLSRAGHRRGDTLPVQVAGVANDCCGTAVRAETERWGLIHFVEQSVNANAITYASEVGHE